MKNWFVICSALVLFWACNAQDPISREYRCWFLFSSTDHPTSILITTIQSPGSYARVTTHGDGKTTPRHVLVRSNDPSVADEDNIIRSAIENELRYELREKEKTIARHSRTIAELRDSLEAASRPRLDAIVKDHVNEGDEQ